MVGDFNFTGGRELLQENKIIQSKFVDVWAKLKFIDERDHQENQRDKRFQDKHATWNTIENNTPRQLGHPYKEHHRPDRFIIPESLLSKVDNIEIIRQPWSDHYGLLFSIKT